MTVEKFPDIRPAASAKVLVSRVLYFYNKGRQMGGNQPKEPNQPREPRMPNEPREPNQPRKPREPIQQIQPREPRKPNQPRMPNEPKEPREPRELTQPIFQSVAACSRAASGTGRWLSEAASCEVVSFHSEGFFISLRTRAVCMACPARSATTWARRG